MAADSGDITRPAPSRRPRRPSYVAKKIAAAIEEDMRKTKITQRGFAVLSPQERRTRIEKRLKEDLGLDQDELPGAKDYWRYWRKHAVDG
jgi:hypothetical protein